MYELLRFGGMAVCGIVLMAVICRIDQMKRRVTRLPWLAMYILYAVYALGVLLDLGLDRVIDWYESAGFGGMVIYMLLTRKRWEEHQDPETIRGELLASDGKPMREGSR